MAVELPVPITYLGAKSGERNFLRLSTARWEHPAARLRHCSMISVVLHRRKTSLCLCAWVRWYQERFGRDRGPCDQDWKLFFAFCGRSRACLLSECLDHLLSTLLDKSLRSSRLEFESGSIEVY